MRLGILPAQRIWYLLTLSLSLTLHLLAACQVRHVCWSTAFQEWFNSGVAVWAARGFESAGVVCVRWVLIPMSFFLLCFSLSRSFWPRNVPLGWIHSAVSLYCAVLSVRRRTSVRFFSTWIANLKSAILIFLVRVHGILNVGPATWTSWPLEPCAKHPVYF